MRFTDTTKVAITIVDRRRTAKFPASVAELISAPSPNVESTCPLKWKYSATMLAFQAPPDAVTKPVIRYGKMVGRMTVRQRSNWLKRKMSATSRNSDGSRDSARDHIKQHVPLRAEEHQQNGAGVEFGRQAGSSLRNITE